jgi:hypothetical protein
MQIKAPNGDRTNRGSEIVVSKRIQSQVGDGFADAYAVREGSSSPIDFAGSVLGHVALEAIQDSEVGKAIKNTFETSEAGPVEDLSVR